MKSKVYVIALSLTFNWFGHSSVVSLQYFFTFFFSSIKVKETITDCIKLKKYDIIVVHGKGTGVIKKEVHEYLKKDKRVLSYKTDNLNDGVTLVKLKGEGNE